MTANPLHVVFGAGGPVGAELIRLLAARGTEVRAVCRSGRAAVPGGVEVITGDARDADQVRQLCAGAAVAHCCIGMPYPQWQTSFPPAVEALLVGAEYSKARLVFVDNLYGYGPVDGPLTEDLPGTDYGVKPALRARLAERILAAHQQGRVRATIARASDFYGPGVTNAALGERVFPALLQGRRAQVLGDPDQLHTYTYVPDLARALVTLADSETAWGQVWHVPSAPTVSTREVLEIAARLAGQPLQLTPLPGWLLKLLALFNPVVRELGELQYQWTRPFVVDHARFGKTFWDDATPLEQGLEATLDWYRRTLA